MVTVKLIFHTRLWNVILLVCITLLSIIAYLAFCFMYD
jgi:uncharacterized membrane protein affecting hemolysin expression